jgi:hypothetical protein
MDLTVHIPDRALDVRVRQLFPVQCKGPADDSPLPEVTAFLDVISLGTQGRGHQHVSCPRFHEYVDGLRQEMKCSSEPYTDWRSGGSGMDRNKDQGTRATPCKYYRCGHDCKEEYVQREEPTKR